MYGIDNLVTPEDLKGTLTGNKAAAIHFEAFPRSVKKYFRMDTKRKDINNERKTYIRNGHTCR